MDEFYREQSLIPSSESNNEQSQYKIIDFHLIHHRATVAPYGDAHPKVMVNSACIQRQHCQLENEKDQLVAL